MTIKHRFAPLSISAAISSSLLTGTALSSGCSSSTEPSGPSLHLEGTYAARSVTDATPFRRIWFARDGRYRAYLAKCNPDCNESGTFLLDGQALVLREENGTERRLPASFIVPEAAKPSAVSGLRARTDTSTITGDASSAACAPGDGADLPPLPAEDGAPSNTGSEGTSLVTGGQDPLVACSGSLLAGGIAPGVSIDDAAFDRIGNRDMTLVAFGSCGGFNTCQSYTCWTCTEQFADGCAVVLNLRNIPCSTTYICPSRRVSRCTGPFDSNTYHLCGDEDRCAQR